MNGIVPKSGAASRRGLTVRVLGTVLSLALLVYLVQAQGWDEIRDAVGRVPPAYLVLAAVFILLSRVCVTLRWLALLRYASARVTFWQTFRLMFAGSFASNFLPSTIGGDLVRMAGSVALGVSAATSMAALVLDRLLGMAGMACLAPIGMVLVTRPQISANPSGVWLLVGGFAGFRQSLENVPVLGKLAIKLRQFISGLAQTSKMWFHRPMSLVIGLMYTFGHMMFTFLTIWLLLHGMHQPVSLLWIGALWSLSYFVSLVPVSINGLGLQEVSITMLYSQFGGVSMEAALALALFMRMLFLMVSLPGAFFVSDILRTRPKTTPAETGDSSSASF